MEVYEHLTTALIKHEVGNFKNWFYSVVSNHCRMALRRRKSEPTTVEASEELLDALLASAPAPHEDDDSEREWRPSERRSRGSARANDDASSSSTSRATAMPKSHAGAVTRRTRSRATPRTASARSGYSYVLGPVLADARIRRAIDGTARRQKAL